MNCVTYNKLQIKGETGLLVEKITDHWLIGLRETNPAIIDMFRDRDVKPYRELLPWSGEFAGKYITGAYYAYKLTGRRDLYDYIINFIDEMISYQDVDGYLGCYAKESHLTGANSHDPTVGGMTWDSWANYHNMFGLLLWYELTQKGTYLQAVEKAAHLFMNTFYDGKRTIVSTGSSEMNLAVYHVFALLYNKTENAEYLDFALKIEQDLADEAAGDYINCSQKGLEFYQCPKPRWESLHIIMGIAEMYRNTGNRMYLDVASQIFYSILKTDVHNTGAFSTDEQALGHPFKNSNIETCCVIAYNALGIDIYNLTGDVKIIDFLERSHYNAVLGYYSPSGKWSTYNTPMDGVKCANYHSINFQCRPGSPDLNCCSVNAPRGVAAVSEWLLTKDSETLYLNFYEDMHIETEEGVSIEVTGGYPANGVVQIHIHSNKENQKVAFRIPKWSKNTIVTIKGEKYLPSAGEYFTIDATKEAKVEIAFDYTPYIENGALDYEGKSSIYIGPILYGYDACDNAGIDWDNIPAIDNKELQKAIPVQQKDGSIQLGFSNGIVLKDFYHLGSSGSFYKTWLDVNI